MTVPEAITTICDIIKAIPIYGARFDSSYEVGKHLRDHLVVGNGDRLTDITLRWEQAWAIHATLRVSLYRVSNTQRGQPVKHLRVDCQLSWPCSDYPVNRALAYINLLKQVTSLAALIEASIDNVIEHEAAPVVEDRPGES